MKKVIVALMLMFSTMVANQAVAGNACETVLCMYGKVVGSGGGSACSGPIRDYFSIIKYRKKKVNWGATSNARQSFLDSCPGADRSKTKQINSKFGKAWG